MNKLYLLFLPLFFSGTLFAQGADEPCNATVHVVADECDPNVTEVEYVLSGFTSTFPSSQFGCGGNIDFFIQFIAPIDGEIIITMTSYGHPGLFTQGNFAMNLMEGSCSNLTIVDTETFTSDEESTPVLADCIDMSADGLGNGNNSPIALYGLTPGQTYYLRVTEEQNDINAYMDLIFSEPLENDDCAQAILLTGNDSYMACNFEGTDTNEPDIPSWTSGAHTGTFGGQNQPVQQCTSWSSNENMVWYTFEVLSTTPQPISITAENVMCMGGAGDLQLGIWYQGNNTACDIGNMQGVGCAVGLGDLTVTLPDDVPNGTYYVAMDGNAGALCTWEFTSDQIFPTCPTIPTATIAGPTNVCSGSSINIDLAFSVAGLGDVIGQFDLTVSPSAGVTFSSGPNDILEGTETINFPVNQTCAPIQYTISANAKCSDGSDIDNDPTDILVSVYPSSLSIVVIDDGTSCGTPTVELQSASGITCESQSGIGIGAGASGSCSTNGDALSYDFSTTATAIALSTAPSGCTLPALTGIITCSACINCSIVELAAGPQSACDPNTNTYTQDITITFTDAPTLGNIDVNGQVFAIGTSPQTITLTDLVADGNPVNVTAFFTTNTSCTLTANNLFTAPTTCVSCTDGIQNGQETGLDCGGPTCPTCPICTVSQYYSGAVFSGIYQTANTIGSSALIFNTEDVSFLAGCINLDPMFEVQLGAEFLADPVPCIPLTSADNPSSLQQEDIIVHATVTNDREIVFNYFLPENNAVKLTLKSINGSFEEILYNESKIKGQHMVQITPNTLKSGVYMLVLKTTKGEKIERIVIH